MVYGTEKEEFAKNEIRKKIMELQREINNYENDIIEINESIKRNCVRQYGKHDFERQIDSGPYPESWWVCTKCGFEK
jgi:hypothetical protein|uniref:Uncharacterized protein n=1 Tax=viral metagenome TaxID=1070528 RepID=A0A6C0CK09_9ZZZZ